MTTTGSALTDQLLVHAAAFGVEPGYWDVAGRWHDASPVSVLAVLESLGAPVELASATASSAGLATAVAELAHAADLEHAAVIPPVVCAIGSGPVIVDLCLPERVGASGPGGSLRVEIVGADGEAAHQTHALDDLEVVGLDEVGGRPRTRCRLTMPVAPVPVGSHELRVESGTWSTKATLLVAPEHVHQLGARERRWGMFAPVYALRGGGGLGPDLAALGRLAEWVDGHGGKIVATLPMLSAFLDQPFEPSPYSPVSRQFWNESYLDVERLPELARSAAAQARLDRPETRAEIARLRDADRYDATGQARLVSHVLAELAVTFFEHAEQGAPGFDRWVERHPSVVDYARFRAVAERYGAGWHDWPARLRVGGITSEDYDVRVAARHVYAQWSMDRQMAQLSSDLSDRDQLLYLDLPVGAAAGGFDTWIDRDDYAWGVSVGAPPDEFFAAGQNWGFPPLRPAAARAEGHRHLAACLRHHMAHAGMLRLDHVMGLHRLFFVPDGMDATHGVYVRYPTEEQFAVVAIESVRAECAVVGEDLGTVPSEVREAMDRHRVLRSFVAEFAMPEPGGDIVVPDHRSVASVDTHDTPTFTGFVRGVDIDARAGAGRLSAEEADAVRADRARACEALAAALAARGLGAEPASSSGPRRAHPLLGGLLTLLAESEAPALLLALDDLVGETDPQNVPGTVTEHANWVRRLPLRLDELAVDAEVSAMLDRVQAARLASHLRSG